MKPHLQITHFQKGFGERSKMRNFKLAFHIFRYIQFLIAAQKVFSHTEAAKCHPATKGDGPAHDAYMRLLHRCQMV
jgi:hypothetical protein